MPTIGWFEILIVVAIAIIVLGPKDFPVMLKKAGLLFLTLLENPLDQELL